MFCSELKIPEKRVAVLIGKKGSTKYLIQKQTKTKIDVSKDGDVFIQSDDGLNCFLASNIIKSIGRGFNPDIAITLLDEENHFELIDITEFTGKSQKKFRRIKARVIGREGRARKLLERLTKCNISVYGKTVCVIGPVESCILAKQAIEKLLKGSKHGNVYKFLEKGKKRIEKEEFFK